MTYLRMYCNSFPTVLNINHSFSHFEKTFTHLNHNLNHFYILYLHFYFHITIIILESKKKAEKELPVPP